MTEFNFSQLSVMMPELFLAVAAMVLLVAGVFRGNQSTRFICNASMAALGIALLLMLGQEPSGGSVLNGMFAHDSFTFFVKFLIIVGLIVSIALSTQYLYQDDIIKFEYPILILFAGIGMMIMVSANDMLSLYVGLELQSLSLYVLAAIRKTHLRSAESGMKYFILGAISSGILLFGISLIYGFVGSTNFDVIASTLSQEAGLGNHLGAVIGFVFVLAALAFKISAVPFHMWTPDVYEGAPTSVTAFFALVPKLAAIALIIRLLFIPFLAISEQWLQIIWFLSFASMAVGAFAGLRQNNIKRLLAYSSIGNIGYALIGIAAGNEIGVSAVLVYMVLYMVMTAGVFGIILCMRHDGAAVESISDLGGLSQRNPWLAYPLAIMMFSMSGIPPLAGFFGKLMVFQAGVQSGLYILAIFGVLTSVVAAYYYLRIIKVMFFDDPAEKFDSGIEFGRKLVIGLSVTIIVLFILNPSPLIEISQSAARSLF
jgi:NADH-quinone oxidoreductase subunit N